MVSTAIGGLASRPGCCPPGSMLQSCRWAAMMCAHHVHFFGLWRPCLLNGWFWVTPADVRARLGTNSFRSREIDANVQGRKRGVERAYPHRYSSRRPPPASGERVFALAMQARSALTLRIPSSKLDEINGAAPSGSLKNAGELPRAVPATDGSRAVPNSELSEHLFFVLVCGVSLTHQSPCHGRGLLLCSIVIISVLAMS